MNFYKHYIGDFQRDTGHLSLTERGAYRALLDHHYATEKPLPADTTALCRLVGAVSKAEREAVANVLREFWHQDDSGGWINRRAMKEMEKASESEDGAELRRLHERERQKRARERRAAMYEELRSRGITPPFDATTSQLRSLLDAQVTSSVTVTASKGNSSVTPNVTPNVTRDITAIQTPDTRHQTKEKEPSASIVPIPGAMPANAILARTLRDSGIAVNPSAPRLMALADAGCPASTLEAAIAEAKAAQGPQARIPANYVLAICERWMAEPQRAPHAAYDPLAVAAETERLAAERDRRNGTH